MPATVAGARPTDAAELLDGEAEYTPPQAPARARPQLLVIACGAIAREVLAVVRANGWDHVTYGAFSTAAAASKLFGLDVERTTQALNLAGTPNVTLRQTRAGELSEWKGCAFALRAGQF